MTTLTFRSMTVAGSLAALIAASAAGAQPSYKHKAHTSQYTAQADDRPPATVLHRRRASTDEIFRRNADAGGAWVAGHWEGAPQTLDPERGRGNWGVP